MQFGQEEMRSLGLWALAVPVAVVLYLALLLASLSATSTGGRVASLGDQEASA